MNRVVRRRLPEETEKTEDVSILKCQFKQPEAKEKIERLDVVNERIEELKAENKRLKAENKQLEAENKKLKAENDPETMKKQMFDLIEPKNNEIRKLKDEIENLNEKIKKMQTTISSYKNDGATVDFNKILDSIEAEKALAMMQFKGIENQLSDLEIELASSISECFDYKTTIASLNKQIEMLNDQISKLQSEHKEPASSKKNNVPKTNENNSNDKQIAWERVYNDGVTKKFDGVLYKLQDNGSYMTTDGQYYVIKGDQLVLKQNNNANNNSSNSSRNNNHKSNKELLKEALGEWTYQEWLEDYNSNSDNWDKDTWDRWENIKFLYTLVQNSNGKGGGKGGGKSKSKGGGRGRGRGKGRGAAESS